MSHSTLGGVITIATSSGGDHSNTSFTVVGKDMAGNSITEIISGVGSGLMLPVRLYLNPLQV